MARFRGYGGRLYVNGREVGEVKEFGLRDSGEREDFSTGSRRDTRKGKGRFDLISPRFMRRLAKVLEKGADKYGERNWEKGQPLGRYLDSALRHINCIMMGMDDEDHAAQAAWNLQALIHTSELIEEGKLPESLDDIGYTRDLDEEERRIYAEAEAKAVAAVEKAVLEWERTEPCGPECMSRGQSHTGTCVTTSEKQRLLVCPSCGQGMPR